MEVAIVTLYFRRMDEDGARALIDWRYEPPYDIYHLEPSPAQLPEFVAFLVDPANRYYRIDNDQQELEAFCCFGDDAQVDGGDYSADALDLGLGVRPDLTRQGRGVNYAHALARFGVAVFRPALLRVTVAAFNTRAQRVWEKLGFTRTQEFDSLQTMRRFIVLTRAPAPLGASMRED